MTHRFLPLKNNHSFRHPPPPPGNDSVCDHNAISAFPQEKNSHYTTVHTLQCRHYNAGTRVQTLECRHYSADTTRRHYSVNITVQTLQCRHYSADTTVQTLQCRHYSADTTVQTSGVARGGAGGGICPRAPPGGGR